MLFLRSRRSKLSTELALESLISTSCSEGSPRH